jgi:hypothetical protein
MNLIFPHIHRIRELSINVMFSSSLPSILTDFHGTAAMMLNLKLQCRADDGGAYRSESVALTDREEFRCPQLRRLAIDGRNCYEVCKNDPQWTTKIASIVKLTISHFHPNPGESFSARELLLPLPAIAELESLRIADLVLHPSPDLVMPDLDFSLVDFLDLEGFHDFEVVGQIIRFLNHPFHVSFSRCNFEDITDQFDHIADIGGGELILAKIDHDLAPLLRLWHGTFLSITDCPRFDDTVLDAMTSTENGAFNCATRVESLRIDTCPNISVAALRRFVESRLDVPVDIDNPWNHVPRISSLQFCGTMSQGEKAWFHANVPGFYRD